MAKRDPYAVPRRGGDVSGPLIRWSVLLVLGAAGAAFAYYFMSGDMTPRRNVEAAQQEPVAASRFASTPPQSVNDATNIDGSQSAAPAANAPAPETNSTAEPAEAKEPEPEAAREARSAPRPRRAPPPPEPEDEPTPPPVANFPVTPTPPAPTPTAPPPPPPPM